MVAVVVGSQTAVTVGAPGGQGVNLAHRDGGSRRQEAKKGARGVWKIGAGHLERRGRGRAGKNGRGGEEGVGKVAQ